MDVHSSDALDVQCAAYVGLLDEEDVVVGRLEKLDDLVLRCASASEVALEDVQVTSTRSPSWT